MFHHFAWRLGLGTVCLALAATAQQDPAPTGTPDGAPPTEQKVSVTEAARQAFTEIRAMEEDREALEPMYDAWAETRGHDDPDGGTFRGLGLRDRLGHMLLGSRRIDYVFFRPRLTVKSIDRIDFSGMEHRPRALPSDHFPVVAEFSLTG